MCLKILIALVIILIRDKNDNHKIDGINKKSIEKIKDKGGYSRKPMKTAQDYHDRTRTANQLHDTYKGTNDTLDGVRKDIKATKHESADLFNFDMK